MTHREKIYQDRINSDLVGQVIKEVFYEELNNESELEYWEHSNEIHSIDMNVILHLESGKIIQIKWDNEFYCYGIGFEKLQEIKKKESTKIIRVTDNFNWKKIIDKRISKINVFWETIEGVKKEHKKKWLFNVISNKKFTIRLPQTWEIEFENTKICISALEIKDNKTTSYWADHLSVFFTKKEIEKYKIMPAHNKG